MNSKRHLWIPTMGLFILLAGMVITWVYCYKIGTYPAKVEEIHPPREIEPRPETVIDSSRVPWEHERLLKKDSSTPKNLKEAYQGYREEDVGKNIFDEERMKEEKSTKFKEIDKVITNCKHELKDDPDNKQVQNRLKVFQLLKSAVSGDFDND